MKVFRFMFGSDGCRSPVIVGEVARLRIRKADRARPEGHGMSAYRIRFTFAR